MIVDAYNLAPNDGHILDSLGWAYYRLGKYEQAIEYMEKAAELDKKLIIAVGNAPTALVRLYELIGEGKIKPALIIGVPVGFVNVVQSKELIMQTNIPYIVARGRKGGSNIAACICYALLKMMELDRGYLKEMK